MAGHSKWANIKHRKARQDAKKGKEWSRCSKAIILAAKQGGGDPDVNLTLRYAIEEAKKCNMPKDTIEKAVKKGTGELGGEAIEQITYEGYAPGGVAVLVEILTDNKNRTAGEIRHTFSKHGGNLGTSGSVAFTFNNRGLITVAKDAADEDQLMELVLEAGAEDFSDEGDYFEIQTDPTQFIAVRQALETASIEPQLAELTMIPTNSVACDQTLAEKVLRLVDALEENDDVNKVHANFDISDEVMAALEG